MNYNRLNFPNYLSTQHQLLRFSGYFSMLENTGHLAHGFICNIFWQPIASIQLARTEKPHF